MLKRTAHVLYDDLSASAATRLRVVPCAPSLVPAPPVFRLTVRCVRHEERRRRKTLTVFEIRFSIPPFFF